MNNAMKYICEERPNEALILEREDCTEEVWSKILTIFGMEEAERIVLSGYKFEAWGLKGNDL